MAADFKSGLIVKVVWVGFGGEGRWEAAPALGFEQLKRAGIRA
jgi:hypothetical protein